MLAATTVSAVSVLSFQPVAGTYVDSRYPNRNFGNSHILKVDGAPTEVSYLKFQLTNLNSPVISAKLRVYITNPSVSGGSISKTNTDWSESTLTYNTRLSTTWQILSTLGKANAYNWYEFDVTPAVTGNGILSFSLKSGHSDGVDYASREDSAHQPQLIITLADSTTSTATPNPTPTPTTTHILPSVSPVSPDILLPALGLGHFPFIK